MGSLKCQILKKTIDRPDGIALVERWRFRRDFWYSRLIRGQLGALGRSSIVCWPFYCTGEPDRIFIGEGVWLHPGCALGTGEQGRIRIGDGTRASGTLSITALESVTIGQSVLIAQGVQIHDSKHRYDDRSVPICEQGMRIRPVRIRDGAWLGVNAVILSGVTIGQNAVVGANSVVTSDVPDFAVAVGSPARLMQR